MTTSILSGLLRSLLPIVALAGLLLVSGAGRSWAHHGWGEFDTTRPLYVAGDVTSVRWANPHPEVRVRVEAGRAVPDDLASLPIPRELEEIGGREVLRATRAYDGDRSELVLVLAPTNRLEAWGMPDELRTGERLQLVGYLNRNDQTELRPELLIRADGTTIRQRSVALPQPPTPHQSANPTTPKPTNPGADLDATDRSTRGDVLLLATALAAPVVALGIIAAIKHRRSRSSS